METVLTIHSSVRWLIVLAGVIAVAGALFAALRKQPLPAVADIASRVFVITADIQLVLGIILLTRIAAVDHALTMVVAIAVAHGGRVAMRKRTDPVSRARVASVWLGLALLLMVVAVPW